MENLYYEKKLCIDFKIFYTKINSAYIFIFHKCF